MKLRLEPAPMTDEDVCIFAHGYRDCTIPPGLPDLAKVPDRIPRPFYRGLVWSMSSEADKHDADIMMALGSLHISTGGDFSAGAVANRRRLYQGFMAHPHALGFHWMVERIARMSEKPGNGGPIVIEAVPQ